jgi:hypothetical protein
LFDGYRVLKRTNTPFKTSQSKSDAAGQKSYSCEKEFTTYSPKRHRLEVNITKSKDGKKNRTQTLAGIGATSERSWKRSESHSSSSPSSNFTNGSGQPDRPELDLSWWSAAELHFPFHHSWMSSAA